MNEQKIIKKQLLKNMFFNFIAFSIIYVAFGLLIFNLLSSSIYRTPNEELIKQKNSFLKSLNNETIKTIEFEGKSGISNTRMSNAIKQNFNPRVTTIIRDKNGKTLNAETMFQFYSENLSLIKFDKEELNKIYEIKIMNEYSYRCINFEFENEEGENQYIQLIINVDSEKALVSNYSKILVIGVTTGIFLSIIASYILSKKTLTPIICSWKKQTEFVQNASHELRTPLTIIQAKQELLLQEPEAKIIDKSEEISLTLNEVKRLTKLTKDLMILANADSNNIQINKENLDIDKLIEEISLPYIDFAKIQEKNIKLNLNCNKSIMIDKNRIYQLLVILLDNAIKYTNEKDEIEIVTQIKDSKCFIEVKDTGNGIKEDAIEKIFDRFYREDEARSRETGGSGLGLSIAYWIVSSHGGTIRALHNNPKGTIFLIKLPIK